MNREIYPGGLYPLMGDVESQVGGNLATVTGIQSIAVDPTPPVSQQVLLYDDVNARYSPVTLSNRASCRVVATTDISIATGLVNGAVIDGVTLTTGDRVLLSAQTTVSENGIYIVVASGTALRSLDCNSSNNYVTGVFTVIEQGTTNAGSVFVVSTQGVITVDTTSVTWVKVSSGGVSRQTVTVTTGILANNAVEDGNVTLAKTFALAELINVSAACRVRLYSTAAARAADASRSATIPPTPGAQHGVICDIVLSTSGSFPVSGFPAAWRLSPEADGSNLESVPSANIPYAITNLSGASASIRVDFVFIQQEQ